MPRLRCRPLFAPAELGLPARRVSRYAGRAKVGGLAALAYRAQTLVTPGHRLVVATRPARVPDLARMHNALGRQLVDGQTAEAEPDKCDRGREAERHNRG